MPKGKKKKKSPAKGYGSKSTVSIISGLMGGTKGLKAYSTKTSKQGANNTTSGIYKGTAGGSTGAAKTKRRTKK